MINLSLSFKTSSSLRASRYFPAFLCTGRFFSLSSGKLLDQNWRAQKGLPENPNKEKILLDRPDYSFTDGRPVPYGSRQKLRVMKQREYTEKIISLTAEIDHGVARHKKLQEEKQQNIQQILKRKLNPKGTELLEE